MKHWLLTALMVLLVSLTGCGGGGPDVTGSKAPLTEEEKRKIAEEDKRVADEESPGNRTLKPKNKPR
jgi:predicted small lipoprotein YifL